MANLKDKLSKFLLFIVSLLLVIMTSLVLWQVITRYFLKNPATFTDELVRYILIWSGFIGAAYGFGTNQHVALTFLGDSVKGSKKYTLNIVLDILVILFVSIVMIYGGYSISMKAFENDLKTPVLQIQKGLVYSVLPFSGFMIVLYKVINIVENCGQFNKTKEIDKA